MLRPICIPQLAKARNALTCSSGSLQSRATAQPAWNIKLKRRCRGLPTAPELPYLHLHPTPTSSKTWEEARALSESVVNVSPWLFAVFRQNLPFSLMLRWPQGAVGNNGNTYARCELLAKAVADPVSAHYQKHIFSRCHLSAPKMSDTFDLEDAAMHSRLLKTTAIQIQRTFSLRQVISQVHRVSMAFPARSMHPTPTEFESGMQELPCMVPRAPSRTVCSPASALAHRPAVIHHSHPWCVGPKEHWEYPCTLRPTPGQRCGRSACMG